MNKRLKLSIVIIVLFFVLLAIPYVLAEEKFVPVWIQIKATNSNITITSQNILEPKVFTMTGLQNTSKVQNFSYIIRTDLTCTESELRNLTKSLINACTITGENVKVCSEIFSVNTELSGQIGELRIKIDGQQNMQTNLQDCQSQLTTEKNKKNPATQNNLGWFIGGAVVGLGAFAWYNSSRKRSGAEYLRGGSRQ